MPAQGRAAAGPLLPANGPLLLFQGGLFSAQPPFFFFFFCKNLQIQPILGNSWETPWFWNFLGGERGVLLVTFCIGE